MISSLRRAQGKLIPLGFLSLGVFLLMQIILPAISFQIWAIGQQYSNKRLISPKESKQVLGISVQNNYNFPAFVSMLRRGTKANYDSFRLSIPKLKIDNADVLVDTNDLSKNLAHLPGSALPGEKGNVFISGHSALSQAFPLRNAFFSNLPELKKGDQIVLETLGTNFIYEIIDFKIVDPNDLSVLPAPEDQGRYVSLMTCVPPGLNFKRLVVLGKMI